MKKTTRNWTIFTGVVVVLLVAGAVTVSNRVDTTVNLGPLNELTRQEMMPTMELPVLGQLPEIEGIQQWFNIEGEELTNEDLEGKVVLIDFWTYSCINCIRTLPFITEWHDRYAEHGLLIVGVHTPEFQFEEDPDNVMREMEKRGIEYPVGLDNDYITWRNFNNRFWPAKYLFDPNGDLRYRHFGEGKYEETEAAIQQLLIDTGADLGEIELLPGVTPDFSQIRSRETYFGYNRTENFASREYILEDTRKLYSFDQERFLQLNEWALEGVWFIDPEKSILTSLSGRFQFQFNAKQVNLVMGQQQGPVEVVVYIDGAEVNRLTVEDHELYELVTLEDYGEHLLELRFNDIGVELYAITFG